MATSYSSDQMDEVWSWVHDERKCVTSFKVAMTLGVSRTLASVLLRDLPLHRDNGGGDVKYEVTTTTLVETKLKDGTKQTGEHAIVDVDSLALMFHSLIPHPPQWHPRHQSLN
jgi:hypothetical protein